MSTSVGPIFETQVFTLRANYIFQSASYFPLLGYYLGDRAGPFGEVKFHPVQRLEIYASASNYENNLAKDPTLPTFRNSVETAGASVQLPAKRSLNGQLTLLYLSTRTGAESPWAKARNQQETLTVSRRFGRHN